MNDVDIAALVFQVLAGLALAASAGLRAFLPLWVAGLAGRYEVIPLAGPFEWLASTPALWVFGIAVVAEVASDKIPIVDSFLDAIQLFVKPVAGTILAASVVTELDPLWSVVLGIVLGGGTAGAVQVLKANVRLVSTVTTGGTANPLVSAAEDAGSLVGSLAAVLWVPLALVVVVAFAVWAWYVVRRRRRLVAPA